MSIARPIGKPDPGPKSPSSPRTTSRRS